MVLGFEQANRYTVLDQDGNTVALLAEDQGSLGKAVGRQLLRTRRSFTATVFSSDGGHCLHAPVIPPLVYQWCRTLFLWAGSCLALSAALMQLCVQCPSPGVLGLE